MWKSFNGEFSITLPDKMIIKYDSWCQTLGQFTDEHFPDLKQNSWDLNNMKYYFSVSTWVKFKSPRPLA